MVKSLYDLDYTLHPKDIYFTLSVTCFAPYHVIGSVMTVKDKCHLQSHQLCFPKPSEVSLRKTPIMSYCKDGSGKEKSKRVKTQLSFMSTLHHPSKISLFQMQLYTQYFLIYKSVWQKTRLMFTELAIQLPELILPNCAYKILLFKTSYFFERFALCLSVPPLSQQAVYHLVKIKAYSYYQWCAPVDESKQWKGQETNH